MPRKRAPLQKKHSTHSTVLVAADLNHAALIGWQDLQKLRVIPTSFPAVAAVAQCYKDIKTKTLAVFLSVFSDTLDNKPMCVQKMHIHVKDTCVPYRVSAPVLFLFNFRNRQMLGLRSTLHQASLFPATSLLIGVCLPLLFLRATGNAYAWLQITPN